jgi:aspartyl protease family protein
MYDPQFWYLLLLVVMLSTGLVVRYRGIPLTKTLQHALIWVILFAIILVGYGYRTEMSVLGERLKAELMPSHGQEVVRGQVEYRSSVGGHYYIHGSVNGVSVKFLLDTGATHTVLSPADAERVGFDLEDLHYAQVFQTANGVGYGARVVVEKFSVAPLNVREMRVSVNKAQMEHSLLGMEFLRRLDGYEVKRGVLTLYQR